MDPWEVVIAPFIQHWQEGAVDHLGSDPFEEQEALRDLDRVAQENDLGRILHLIAAQKDIAEYAATWKKEIDPVLLGLSPSRRERVEEAHKRKKAELMGGK